MSLPLPPVHILLLEQTGGPAPPAPVEPPRPAAPVEPPRPPTPVRPPAPAAPVLPPLPTTPPPPSLPPLPSTPPEPPPLPVMPPLALPPEPEPPEPLVPPELDPPVAEFPPEPTCPPLPFPFAPPLPLPFTPPLPTPPLPASAEASGSGARSPGDVKQPVNRTRTSGRIFFIGAPPRVRVVDASQTATHQDGKQVPRSPRDQAPPIVFLINFSKPFVVSGNPHPIASLGARILSVCPLVRPFSSGTFFFFRRAVSTSVSRRLPDDAAAKPPASAKRGNVMSCSARIREPASAGPSNRISRSKPSSLTNQRRA